MAAPFDTGASFRNWVLITGTVTIPHSTNKRGLCFQVAAKQPIPESGPQVCFLGRLLAPATLGEFYKSNPRDKDLYANNLRNYPEKTPRKTGKGVWKAG